MPGYPAASTDRFRRSAAAQFEGVRDDMARDVAAVWSTATCSATRRMAWPCCPRISPKSTRARWPSRAEHDRGQRYAPARSGLGRQPPARTLAHVARHSTPRWPWRRHAAPAPSSSAARHHIACLAAYLHARDRSRQDGAHLLLGPVDEKRWLHSARVSPVFTPNPFAAGIPTSGDPILAGHFRELHDERHDGTAAQGRRAARASVGAGCARQSTTDPAVLFNEPRARCCRWAASSGGHKGYAR